MRLDNFDLNLLVAFDALLEERNVTRAARRLNVTQSAMSASLKRLREALGDPILLQHGKTMMPTPHALALAPEVASAIAALRRLIQPSARLRSRDLDAALSGSPHRTTSRPSCWRRCCGRSSAKRRGVRLDIALPDRGDVRIGWRKGEFDLVLTPEEFLEPGIRRSCCSRSGTSWSAAGATRCWQRR